MNKISEEANEISFTYLENFLTEKPVATKEEVLTRAQNYLQEIEKNDISSLEVEGIKETIRKLEDLTLEEMKEIVELVNKA